MRCTWGGVFPAAITHFRDDQSLDVPAMLCHLDRMVEAGIHGLIMLGTVGENASLEYGEKLEVLRAVVEHVHKRVPVLTGVAECGNRYVLFCGVDDLVLESVVLGAVGWVSGLVNAFPAESRLLWDLASEGRYEKALDLYRWYTPLLHLDTHVKLVQYIKLAVHECGYGSEAVRAPRLPLVGREREEILGLIHQALKTRPTT